MAEQTFFWVILLLLVAVVNAGKGRPSAPAPVDEGGNHFIDLQEALRPPIKKPQAGAVSTRPSSGSALAPFVAAPDVGKWKNYLVTHPLAYSVTLATTLGVLAVSLLFLTRQCYPCRPARR